MESEQWHQDYRWKRSNQSFTWTTQGLFLSEGRVRWAIKQQYGWNPSVTKSIDSFGVKLPLLYVKSSLFVNYHYLLICHHLGNYKCPVPATLNFSFSLFPPPTLSLSTDLQQYNMRWLCQSLDQIPFSDFSILYKYISENFSWNSTSSGLSIYSHVSIHIVEHFPNFLRAWPHLLFSSSNVLLWSLHSSLPVRESYPPPGVYFKCHIFHFWVALPQRAFLFPLFALT